MQNITVQTLLGRSCDLGEITMERNCDVLIVGAGILGLAHAYWAARRGRKVTVVERTPQAAGASVRNFGMIWPIGQPPGEMLQMALRSREIWEQVLSDSRLPYRADGSLHLVYAAEEENVAREFAELGPAAGYRGQWLDADAVLDKSPIANRQGLRGGIWSDTEMTVDPRVFLGAMPNYLAERFGVTFRFGSVARAVDFPFVETGEERWRTEAIIVCSGDDFETLFPALFRESGLTRCKLQMMRSVPLGGSIGPSLAAGLTLRFYPSFQICPSLEALKRHFAATAPAYDRWGIHVMVSQTDAGELTLGDSHECGMAVDIFNKEEIDNLILDYLQTFVELPDLRIASRWHGVYAKHPAKSFLRVAPSERVRIVTATGGSGMTLSFGLAEQTVAELVG